MPAATHLKDEANAESVRPAYSPCDANEIVDRYCLSVPGPQNALDIFRGQWSSRLPSPYADLEAGALPLFDDYRIHWAIDHLGGVRGASVLELGPLEGGHSYLLEQRGAAEIIAIEANTHAYLKCLIVKEILGLRQARFLCGDCMEFLRTARRRFDLCLASGVLYHLQQPVEMIARCAQWTDRLILWTHYFDADLLEETCQTWPRNAVATHSDYAGFRHTLYRHDYGDAIGSDRFIGGGGRFSYWLSRSDILAALRYFGFSDCQINFEEPYHPNGPCFLIAARK